MALDSERFDLREVFLRLREEMLADLKLGGLLRHGTAIGTAAEHIWLNLFERFLPGRYRASPAFVVDAAGNRSRQIDLVVYDALQSPALFPHSAGLHVPVESVYAVVEVKSVAGNGEVRDAGVKAASVRALRRSRQTVLAGLVASSSPWSAGTFHGRMQEALDTLEVAEMLDLGCLLQHGAFEVKKSDTRISESEESLAFFMIRLSERLRALPQAKPVDLMRYGKGIESLED